MNKTINIIGGGLAGTECAYFLANHGCKVKLYEMKPNKFSPAHHEPTLAEIVCSNSLKGEDPLSSSGLLKKEMEKFDSLILKVANKVRVPAGGALAVDRENFSKMVDEVIKNHPNIEVVSEEVSTINTNEITVIATGPLTSDALSKSLSNLLGDGGLHFFDASSPIVTAESIDYNSAFKQDRYGDLGSGDYLNCPMTKEEYANFYQELINAEVATLHDFEKGEIFEGCMPIEVMAKRGIDSLRFGPLKPVGLGKHLNEKPYAIVQLRKENVEEELYNLVGFQTNLKFGEQKRVFSMIPALKNAEFIKYGVMHRNSYINSPKHLGKDLALKNYNNVYVAGQLSGVEGYVESAASGLVVGISILLRLHGKSLEFTNNTMLGALSSYITNSANSENFQPMNSNYGIISPLKENIKDKNLKRQMIYDRSMAEIAKIAEEIKLCK